MKQHYIGKILAGFLASGPATAGEPTLDDVSRYFNAITTFESDFTQHNNDGTTATGTLYMNRPEGRMRMEYRSGSNGALVIINAGRVAIFDENGGSAMRVPLRKTPLAPILDHRVDLERAQDITSATSRQDRITVFARPADNPDSGVMQFTLSGTPMKLRSWVVANAAGETIRVVLDGTARRGRDIPVKLFSIERETQERTPDRDR